MDLLLDQCLVAASGPHITHQPHVTSPCAATTTPWRLQFVMPHTPLCCLCLTKSQAVGQICSTASMKANLDQCVRLVSKAAIGGAKVRQGDGQDGDTAPSEGGE